MKKFVFALMLSLLLFNFASAYSASYADFNGTWRNGDVLTTDYYHIDDGMFYAKNAYPIASNSSRVKVCETTFITLQKRVCEYQITGYKDRVKKICERVNGQTVCHTENYQVPIKQRVCHYESYQKPKTICKYTSSSTVKILCSNPSGVSTNALLSENFEYQMQGEESWNDIPTNGEDWSNNVKDAWVRFRVTIPLACSPEYDIDRAVVIQER